MSNVIEFVIKGTDKLSGVIDQSVGAWSRMEKVLAAASITAGIYATINLAKKSLAEAEAVASGCCMRCASALLAEVAVVAA